MLKSYKNLLQQYIYILNSKIGEWGFDLLNLLVKNTRKFPLNYKVLDTIISYINKWILRSNKVKNCNCVSSLYFSFILSNYMGTGEKWQSSLIPFFILYQMDENFNLSIFLLFLSSLKSPNQTDTTWPLSPTTSFHFWGLLKVD